ncbi:MAG TPA: HAD-IB family phosphatase [Opitutaceae bacterium]
MKLICLDCDSTLSSAEGVDELARLRGPEVFARVEALTHDAMNGRIRIEDVFGLRLEAIRPTSGDAAAVGRLYVATVEPTAKQAVAALAAAGWTAVIVSGGFRQAIRPLADLVGIRRIEAVDLYFNPDGSYAGYDRDFPSTRSGGKVEIVKRLRGEFSPEKVCLVGDGVSDLEAKAEVDLFVGFGGFATRERVKREAGAWATSLSSLPGLLAGL